MSEETYKSLWHEVDDDMPQNVVLIGVVKGLWRESPISPFIPEYFEKRVSSKGEVEYVHTSNGNVSTQEDWPLTHWMWPHDFVFLTPTHI